MLILLLLGGSVPAVLVTQGYTWDFAKDVLDQVQQPPLPQVDYRRHRFAYNPVWALAWCPPSTHANNSCSYFLVFIPPVVPTRS